ncbi:MAG: lysylphosphatidylglycerol synthase transmembrane domain-containing protein [Bacteroidota bacterium]
MPKEEPQETLLTSEEQKVLSSINVSKVILPTIIGLAAVGYLMWRSFQKQELPTIEWSRVTITWVVISVLLLGVRHLAYMTRLRILTDGAFSWRKCFELIFIWEFSSAVTPTSVGGSAVAMFVLAQEKLAAGKIATIIFYSIVLDTLFFVGFMPILLIWLGPEMLSPGGADNENFVFWRRTFYLAYTAMIVYGTFFFYGIIVNPKRIQRFLIWSTSFKLLKRFREKAKLIASDMVLTAEEIRGKRWTWHAGAFGATTAAWTIRFVLVMCLMIAFVPAVREGVSFAQQSLIYGRLEVMYIVLALSPTPGGVGIAEAAFGPFLSDFIVDGNGTYMIGMAILIAFLWRLLTYYFYLVAGAIVIPNWIRGVINERKQMALENKPSTQ